MPSREFCVNDGLEERIKNICYDPLPKASIRRHYTESVQRLGILAPGSKFCGWQSGNADEQRYEVNVQIQDVNIAESRLSGYLNISNLTTVSKEAYYRNPKLFLHTQEYPELTTFFEAEIIGEKHSFMTHKWDSDEDNDRAHWVIGQKTSFHCLTLLGGLD
jgi:hypothetical protein